MAQKSKEKQQIKQEILDNRRAIQRCEVQMSGVRTLIARYEDEYDDLRSAIGNLSTVIQNIEGIQTYYNHVICTYTGEIHQWWGSEYNYADLEFGHIDTDVKNCQTQVEDMQTQMREKRTWLEGEIETLNQQIRTYQKEIDTLVSANKDLRKKL